MADKSIDLTGCQFTLAAGQSSEILRRYLTQALRVDFLYDNTSNWSPSCGPASS
jgi:hypothetical protein